MSADEESSFIQEAVAEGPNHWPGCLPQEVAPWWTKRCMEKGAAGSSAKREMIEGSLGVGGVGSVDGGGVGVDGKFRLRRHSRPRCSIIRALARSDWPDRIIHAQPVSLLNPSRSARLRRRTENVMPELAEGSEERGMGGKLERYVIHILDSKSSRNGCGHPPSAGSLDRAGVFSLDICCASSKELDPGCEGCCVSSVVDAVASEGSCESAEDSISTTSSWSVVDTGLGGVALYSRPSSHIDVPDMSSYLGGGS